MTLQGRKSSLLGSAAPSPPPPTDPPSSDFDSYRKRPGPKTLRGAKEISTYWFGTPDKFRTIYEWNQFGRMPFYREGKFRICIRVATLEKLIALLERYAMLGRVWGPEDVKKHFPIPGDNEPPVEGE